MTCDLRFVPADAQPIEPGARTTRVGSRQASQNRLNCFPLLTCVASFCAAGFCLASFYFIIISIASGGSHDVSPSPIIDHRNFDRASITKIVFSSNYYSYFARLPALNTQSLLHANDN